jgi:hypothetical protein
MTYFSWASVRNPVMRTELTYQQRSTHTRPRGWFRRLMFWGWQLLLAVAVASAVTLLIIEFTSVIIGYDFSTLPQHLHPLAGVVLFFIPVIVLIPMTLLIHFRTQLRTLALASNVISREKRGGTWELLLLTGVDSPHIVRGKWWATMRHVWRSYALVTLLRAASILWAALEANRINFYTYPAFHFEIRPRYFAPSEPHLLLAILIIVIFTFVNMGYTSAFGTLASVFPRGGGVSLALGIGVRMAAIIGSALVIGLAGHFLMVRVLSNFNGSFDYNSLPWQIYQVLVAGGFTLFENGSVLAGTLATFNPTNAYAYYYDYTNTWIAGAVLALGISLLLTWLSLRIAQWVTRRQGAISWHPGLWLKAKKNEAAA